MLSTFPRSSPLCQHSPQGSRGAVPAAIRPHPFTSRAQLQQTSLPPQLCWNTSQAVPRRARRLQLQCTSAAAGAVAGNGAVQDSRGTTRQKSLGSDLSGGLTAAVVALPLALAFGVASGLGPLPGLYGSIFGGFFAALLGGTPGQISGPTGPMTVVTAGVIGAFRGQPGVAVACVVLAGLLQIAFGCLRLGGFIRLVPLPVVSGFMTGVGCIMVLTQSLAMVGMQPGSSALAAIRAWPQVPAALNAAALGLGALSFALCTFTPKRISSIVPGSLLALVVGTVTSAVLGLDVPVLGAIPSGLPLPQSISVPAAMLPQLLRAATVLAVLGSIDSLLTSLVADSMTGVYHDSDKELVGQGVGNSVCGIFGGLPGAGATMRTVVNIRAGGHTRLSGCVHSIILLGVVLGLNKLAARIPLAVLAGILLKSGWDIVDRDYLKRVRQLSLPTVAVLGVTWALTVFVDLIAAVAAANMEQDTAPMQRTAELDVMQTMGDDLVLFTLQGVFTFNAVNGMMRKLTPALEDHKIAVLDLSQVKIMDETAALCIGDIAKRAEQLGRTFYVCGAGSVATELFDRLELCSLFQTPPSMKLLETLRMARMEAHSQATAQPQQPSTASVPNFNGKGAGEPERATPLP